MTVPSLYFKIAKMVGIIILIIIISYLFITHVTNSMFQIQKHRAIAERKELLANEYSQYTANVSITGAGTYTKEFILQLGQAVQFGPFKFSFVFYNQSSGEGLVSVTDKKHGGLLVKVCTSKMCPATNQFKDQITDYTTNYFYSLTGTATIELTRFEYSVNGKSVYKSNTPMVVVKAVVVVMPVNGTVTNG